MGTPSCLDYRSQLRLRKHGIPSSLEESEVGQSNCWTRYATLNGSEASWPILSAFSFQGKKESVWFQDCWRAHYSSHKYLNYPMTQWPSTTLQIKAFYHVVHMCSASSWALYKCQAAKMPPRYFLQNSVPMVISKRWLPIFPGKVQTAAFLVDVTPSLF